MRSRVLATALCLCLAGCAHYQLGTTGKLAFSTLYIEPVANKVVTLPQAQAPLGTQVRQAFAEDGRVELVDSPQEADATLSIVLTDYHREVAAVRENDTGLASKFVVTLGATCTLRDNRSGHLYFEKRVVTVQRGVYADNGVPAGPATGNQLQSEYNTIPLLAGDMASRLTHVVLDVW
jgi:outer membrane lipopolysaccharide assembly protein LptE/RlpB